MVAYFQPVPRVIGTILGDTFYCDVKIDSNGELLVKGDISIYGNKWFATGDKVVEEQGCFYYIDRV